MRLIDWVFVVIATALTLGVFVGGFYAGYGEAESKLGRRRCVELPAPHTSVHRP